MQHLSPFSFDYTILINLNVARTKATSTAHRTWEQIWHVSEIFIRTSPLWHSTKRLLINQVKACERIRIYIHTCTYVYVDCQLSMSTLVDWMWQQLLDTGCEGWISETPKRFDIWLPRPTGGSDGDNDGFWWIPNQTSAVHTFTPAVPAV